MTSYFQESMLPSILTFEGFTFYLSIFLYFYLSIFLHFYLLILIIFLPFFTFFCLFIPIFLSSYFDITLYRSLTMFFFHINTFLSSSPIPIFQSLYYRNNPILIFYFLSFYFSTFYLPIFLTIILFLYVVLNLSFVCYVLANFLSSFIYFVSRYKFSIFFLPFFSIMHKS